MKKNTLLSAITVLLGLFSVGVANASTFSMAIVADNDYAVFSGTATNVDSLLYQNNYSWSQQIPNLASLNFTLPAGDTKLYVLALGGGGAEENISGVVNGVDMTNATVSMSSDIGPFLTGYQSQNGGGQAVDQGIFNASLVDVQSAFSSLTWGSPTLNSSQAVIQLAAPNHIGYSFATSTAHLFVFSASDVGVQAVPEPSSIGLAVIGFTSLMLFRRRIIK